MVSRRLKRFGLFAFAASGWIAATLVYILNLPAAVNGFLDEAPKATERVLDLALWNSSAFTGNWGDEGDIDAPSPDGNYVRLVLVSKDGAISGLIGSEKMKEGYIASAMSIDGHNGRGDADIEVFDYVGGKRLTYATGKLASAPDGQSLQLTITGQAANHFLPVQTTLHRIDDSQVSDLGGPNVDLISSVLADRAAASTPSAASDSP